MSPTLAWSAAGPLAADHPFHDALASARASGDVGALASAIAARFGVASIHPSILGYARETLAAGRAGGPLRVEGIAEALARPVPAAKIFGRGEGPFPAIAIGGRDGTTFWASLASGRVVTLHHDASLYEEAARVAGGSVEASMRALEAVGSILDVERLLALAAELASTFGEARPEGPLYARVVLDVLGLTPAAGRRLFETLPAEFLGLRAEDCDDLPKKGARTLARAKKPRATKARAPHPRVTQHLAQNGRDATSIDLSYVRLERLPEEILELSALERVDLSGNPKLDLAAAFDALAALPALREVRFADCDVDGTLPPSFAKLRSITHVDVTGWGHHKTANVFDPAQALEVLAAMPNLRGVKLGGRPDPSGAARDRLASAAFASLEELAIHGDVLGVVDDALRGKPALRVLRLTSDVPFGDPRAVAALSSLEELVLDRSREAPGLPPSLKRLVLGGVRSIDPAAVASLEHLEGLELRGVGFEEVPAPHASARLRTLVVSGNRLSRWGAVRDRLADLEVLETAPFEASPPLPPLASTDCPNLRALRAPFDASTPLAKIEALDVGRVPEWVASSATLREVSLGRDVTRDLSIALAAPAIESVSGSTWDAPIEVPEARAFEAASRLRRFAVYGSFADAPRAYASLARAPALEDLEIFLVGLDALPPALADAPLRRFRYHLDAKRPSLDLAAAFRLLAKTPLRDLELGGPNALPPEIALLWRLETLAIRDFVPPSFPDTIAELSQLRRIEMRSAKLVGPARKRLEKALPACAIVTGW